MTLRDTPKAMIKRSNGSAAPNFPNLSNALPSDTCAFNQTRIPLTCHTLPPTAQPSATQTHLSILPQLLTTEDQAIKAPPGSRPSSHLPTPPLPLTSISHRPIFHLFLCLTLYLTPLGTLLPILLPILLPTSLSTLLSTLLPISLSPSLSTLPPTLLSTFRSALLPTLLPTLLSLPYSL